MKTFKDWIDEGEQLYQTLIDEYNAYEKQIRDLETQLVAKKDEVNQIATVIGKQPVDLPKPATPAADSFQPRNTTPATIARALSGNQAVKVL